MSYTIPQLQTVTPVLADLLPLYHVQAGQTYQVTVEQLAALVQGTVVLPTPATLYPYDATILAEPTLVHFYPMDDVAGSLTVLDRKGGTNLSIVNGGSGTGRTGGAILTGAAALLPDAEKTIRFPRNDNPIAGGGTGPLNYITFPASLLGGLSNFSVELIAGDGWNANDYYYSGYPMLISCVASGSDGFELFVGTAGTTGKYGIGGSSASAFGEIPFTMGPAHLVLTVDSGTASLYVNATLVASDTTAALGLAAPTTNGYVGLRSSASDNEDFPFYGRMAKLAIYNAALTQARIEAHYENVIIT